MATTGGTATRALERHGPMLATVGTAIPASDDWTFELKYDGVRVLAFVGARSIRLLTRNSHDKARQFREIVDALAALRARRGAPFVLDGEIIALRRGRPARFQFLQRRVHRVSPLASGSADTTAALAVFDLVVDGRTSLLDRSWTVRRARLEALFARWRNPSLILAESFRGRGRWLLGRARRAGWEGVIAKRIDAPYRPGVRAPDWRKLKLEARQELVVGGWTEPRGTRTHLGALLLGYYDRAGAFVYAGHVGTGFDDATRRDLVRRLRSAERARPPFEAPPRSNARVHWTRPAVVVEVRFSEWTRDGRLRQPVFLGVRDDKRAKAVGREPASLQGREPR